MKLCWIFMHLTMATLLFAQHDPAIAVFPNGRIVHAILDPDSVMVLNLRLGYVSSVQVPDEVSSVVLGNPASFKAEHSEAEPRLVFFKPLGTVPCETNALITTRNGHTISLQLITTGASDHAGRVDFVLEYSVPHSFLVDDSGSDFVIADTRRVGQTQLTADPDSDLRERVKKLLTEKPDNGVHWRGKDLRVAIERMSQEKQNAIVVFSVKNASSKTIELLPPQLQLYGVTRSKRGKPVIADQIPVRIYDMTSRRLVPQAQATVAVAFERPPFKQSNEQVLLQVAQAEEVDHPVLIPIPLVVPAQEGEK